jgi:hypothetical protein
MEGICERSVDKVVQISEEGSKGVGEYDEKLRNLHSYSRCY